MNAIIASVLLSSPERSISPPSVPMPDVLKGIDDLIRAGFEGYRNSCFNWLLGATALVVVGLIFEGPELFHDIVSIVSHWRFKRRFHFSLPEEQASSRAKLLAFAGWLFIVVGVAGEYVADSFVSQADGYVQKFDEILLADAQKQAELAKIRAGGAYERAAAAEKETAQLEKEAAQLRKDAADEQLERVRLEGIVAPRSLSLDQQRRIADACRKFSGHAVLVKSYGTDGEGAALAAQIIAALRSAGIVVADSSASQMVMGQFDTGVHVRAPILEVAFAATLSNALSSIGKLDVVFNDPEPKSGAGFSGGGQSFTNPRAVFVTVSVGIKPQPTLPAK